MAKRNVKVDMTPLGAADKPRLLRKLHGSIYFEKDLTAFEAGLTKKASATVLLPAEFVENYGDKFRKSALLRTESSKLPWHVNLSISFCSPYSPRVRFEGGWKAFAVSHGLLEGDTLIFELTAMSDFKVHIFRGIGGTHTTPPKQKRQKRSAVGDPNRSRKKAKKPDAEREEECEGGDEVGRTGMRSDWRNREIKSEDSDFDPPIPVDDPGSLDHLPSFTKTLTATNVRPDAAAYFEFPNTFWRMHGHRIHSGVRLQGIQEQAPVSWPMHCYTSVGQDTRHYLKAEWRTFAYDNDLQQGQKLVFTLAADSFFVVRDGSGARQS